MDVINAINGKRVLITGKDSYIGTSVRDWLLEKEEKISVDEVCLKNDQWREMDFSVYDVVFHVAGIVHSDIGKASDKTKALYYQVNTDLALEVAATAKSSGVSQFIFMSSIIVYGIDLLLGETQAISYDTLPNPTNFYGDSKLQAEHGLSKLKCTTFKVVIIRPPMVYGKASKGNYPRLVKLAKTIPIFPDIDNVRSMLHIDNLCEFVRLLINDAEDGIFHPQNAEYVKTSELVALIAQAHGRKMRLVRVFNPFLKLFSKRVGVVNKVFGNLYYDKQLSEYEADYCIRNFKESIELTEK